MQSPPINGVQAMTHEGLCPNRRPPRRKVLEKRGYWRGCLRFGRIAAHRGALNACEEEAPSSPSSSVLYPLDASTYYSVGAGYVGADQSADVNRHERMCAMLRELCSTGLTESSIA